MAISSYVRCCQDRVFRWPPSNNKRSSPPSSAAAITHNPLRTSNSCIVLCPLTMHETSIKLFLLRLEVAADWRVPMLNKQWWHDLSFVFKYKLTLFMHGSFTERLFHFYEPFVKCIFVLFSLNGFLTILRFN